MAPNKLPPGSRDRRQAEMKSPAVTIKDVARLAGVSPITVSRAMNRPEIVSKEALDSIEKAISQLGYVPNMLAGGLRSSQSRLIAAIVPSIATSMFADAVEALTDVLNGAGYEVLLGLSGFDRGREDNILSAILSRKPDAVYLTGIEHSPRARQQLLAARIPVVESWDLTPTPIDLAVGFSHDKVGRAAAQLFLEKGYDRIAVLSSSDRRALQRRDGFLAEMQAHGRTGIVTRVTETPGSLERGREAFADLLDSGIGLDAVFCAVDPLAQGVITEAQVRKLAVPGDISVMGFGNFSFSQFMSPSLTTINIDRRKIGRLAAELMLAELNGMPSFERVIDIGFEVLHRESTGR